jgi:hypothetical protein
MSKDIKAQIRKYNNDIKICGIGVIVLSIWSMIRFYLTVYFSDVTMADLFDFSDDMTDFEIGFIVVFFWIIMAITVLIHLYLGMSAIKYSMGKKKRCGFLILVFVYVVMDLSSIVVFLVPGESSTNDTKFASILLDITSLYFSFDMIYAVIRVKMLRKKQRKE